MEIVYPRPKTKCPDYLHIGGDKWRYEVRIANEFGTKSEYNMNDTVSVISFYFPDSQSHRQNEVVIRDGTITNISNFGIEKSYTVTFSDGCGIITTSHYLKRNN